MKTGTEIKQYYDEFSKSTLLRDFRIVNLRQQAIKRLCDRFVPRGASVLEIGCGAGIISRHLSGRVSRLVGIDISETAVRMARLYVPAGNCEFRTLDITDDAADLKSLGTFDVILMPDVLEHIPRQLRRGLFARLEGLLGPRGLMLATYPSPDYQEYLRREKPELLQVVDETLELSEILAETSLHPAFFSYVDAGERNQYNHLALRPAAEYAPEAPPVGPAARFARAGRKALWRLRNAAFLRKVKNAL